VSVGLGLWIEYVEVRTRTRMTWWSARWAELSAADPRQLDEWLQSARLVAFAEPLAVEGGSIKRVRVTR
jgi:hypothetical protein